MNFLDRGKTLLELGCGNGRDSIFFAEKGKVVSALDLSIETIKNLSSMNVKNADFFHQDFSQLTNFKDVDYVYSRFTLHSVDEETERLVFQQLPRALKKGGLFLMEARSLKDESLEKAYGKNHFRRYLDYEETIEKLERRGFSVLEKCESQGLAPYKKEDPFLIRVVAERL
jgi:cyclopropane fatty-acyl-phospholipid synthase-like methyltransferase